MPGSSLSCRVLLHRTRSVASGGTRSRRCRYSVSRSHLGHSDLRAGLSEHCFSRTNINGIVRARPLRSDSTGGGPDDGPLVQRGSAMAKASHGVNRHFGQVPQTSFGLPTPAVNDKGRSRSNRASGSRHRHLRLYGRQSGQRSRNDSVRRPFCE